MSFSILILTKNEELNLPDCLESVAWADDVQVFDSFSRDRTVEIAKRFGATVTQRCFDGFATQRNAALDELNFKHPWVLVLDADERLGRGLAAELQLMRFHSGDEVAYRVRQRDFLGKQRLDHGGRQKFPVRFIRRDAVRYAGTVDEQVITSGRVGQLEAPLDHHPFTQGFENWLERKAWHASFTGRTRKDEGSRTCSVKPKLPIRALVTFAKRLLLQRCYLDGKAGITLACLQLIHEGAMQQATTHKRRNSAAEASAMDHSPTRAVGDC